MAGALALLLALSASPIAEPTGVVAWLSTSTSAPTLNHRVFSGLEHAFAAHTVLEVRPAATIGLDEAKVRACAGDFLCWLEAAEASSAPAPAQIVVTHATAIAKGRYKLLIAMLDPALADGARAAAQARHPGDRETANAHIFRVAVQTESYVGAMATQAEVNGLILRFMKQQETWLVQARQWQTWTQVNLELVDDLGSDAEVQLGTMIVPAPKSSVRIERVRPGQYPLTLRSSQGRFVPLEQLVDVPTSSVVDIALPAPDFARSARTYRQLTRWGGVAAFAVGTVFLVHALTPNSNRNQLVGVCPPDCESSNFVRLGPLLEAPLGYSLMAAGATWTAGSFIEGEPYEAPIWSSVLGAVLGAAAYGLSAALD